MHKVRLIAVMKRFMAVLQADVADQYAGNA